MCSTMVGRRVYPPLLTDLHDILRSQRNDAYRLCTERQFLELDQASSLSSMMCFGKTGLVRLMNLRLATIARK
jgi:hypothetical protein